jgi:hypothetical protein
MRKLLAVLLCLGGLCGCVTAPHVSLMSGAEVVRVAKADPSDNYQEVGPVSGYDGSGCGIYGYCGSYERAMINIMNRAHQMGADYVQIFTITEPHLDSDCYNNIYKISGTAYKKVRDLPSPTPIVNQTTGNNDLVEDKLKTLNKLLADGLITQKEFDDQKQKLLNDYTSK